MLAVVDWDDGKVLTTALPCPCEPYFRLLVRRNHHAEAHTASPTPGMLTHMTSRQWGGVGRILAAPHNPQ